MTDNSGPEPRRAIRSIGILLPFGIIVAVVGAFVGLRVSSRGPSSTVHALGTTSSLGTTSYRAASATNVTASTPATAGSRLASTTACQTPFPVSERPVARGPAPNITLSWLPSGATFQYHQDCRFPGAMFGAVSLPGRANADTVPPTGIPIGLPPAPGSPAYHPADYISVEAIAGMSMPPRPLPLSSEYSRVTISVNGHPATVSYPNNGLGGYNIAWVQGGDYVQIHSDRGLTSNGLSGVPLSQLEQVAEGLRLS